MSLEDHNPARNSGKRTRRSKKRRTADSSDSETSSSSSSSGSESEHEQDEQNLQDNEGQLEISDVELSDAEDKDDNAKTEVLGKETKELLNRIPFTTTELSNGGAKNINNIDLSKIQRTIEDAQENVSLSKDEGQLKNAYLNLLFRHYGEDVNSLREAPDFTPKSLVLIANVLKDGAHMFDIDTLRTVMESEQ
ncbi:LAQU0S24e00936g1_1 [Lachancea quebecensis]|uniref:Ribosome assembly protein 3 n=1 Tax=Lachancea quebecensis TaxID=1654605 RepID=A0A0N7MNF8_9SACH|nr:LAQU0S24e00936g1_1 [Lachancea quebecensis]